MTRVTESHISLITASSASYAITSYTITQTIIGRFFMMIFMSLYPSVLIETHFAQEEKK